MTNIGIVFGFDCRKILYQFHSETTGKYFEIVFSSATPLKENESCLLEVLLKDYDVEGVESVRLLSIGMYKGLFTLGDASDIFAKFYTE